MDTKKFSSLESKALQWKCVFLELFDHEFKVDIDKKRDDISYAEIFTAYYGRTPLQSYVLSIFLMMQNERAKLTKEDKETLAEIEGWNRARSLGFRLLSCYVGHCSRFFYRLKEKDESLLVVEHNFDECPIYEIWLVNDMVEFKCDAQIFAAYNGIFTIRPVRSLDDAKKRYPELSAWIEQGKIRFLSSFMGINF